MTYFRCKPPWWLPSKTRISSSAAPAGPFLLPARSRVPCRSKLPLVHQLLFGVADRGLRLIPGSLFRRLAPAAVIGTYPTTTGLETETYRSPTPGRPWKRPWISAQSVSVNWPRTRSWPWDIYDGTDPGTGGLNYIKLVVQQELLGHGVERGGLLR